MRLQLQMAEDLSKLVSFSKLKWRVSNYHFTVFFFAQIAAPCWQSHENVHSRASASEFINTVKESLPPSRPRFKTSRKTKINHTLFRINEMALRAL